MLRNLKSVFAMFAVVGALGVFSPNAADATYTITNTGTVSYDNEASIAQSAVSGATTFTAESDPVLSVVKTRDIGSGPSGTTVTWDIEIGYPRIADSALVCGDDSDAAAVTVTDAVPGGFTYDPGTIRVSTDGGATFGAAGTDASDGVDASGFDVSFAGGTVTAVLGTIVEGTGDLGNCPAAASSLVVRFQATKD